MKIHNTIKQSSFYCTAIISLMTILVSGCKKSSADTPNGIDSDHPTSVIVSLSINGSSRLRTAGVPGANKVNNGDNASISNVDIYLSGKDGEIFRAERIQGARVDKLILQTPNLNIDPPADRAGIKFLNVSTRVTQVAVVVNSTEPTLTVGQNISEVKVGMPGLSDASVSKRISYAAKSDLEVKGMEPWGVDPQTTGEETVVRVADFSVPGLMNRFQVATKFCRITFKDGMAEKYDALRQAVADKLRELPSSDAVRGVIKHLIGSSSDDLTVHAVTPTEDDLKSYGLDTSFALGWADYFKIQDITSWNTAACMNYFYYQYYPFGSTISTNFLYTSSYRQCFIPEDGVLKLLPGDDDMTRRDNLFDKNTYLIKEENLKYLVDVSSNALYFNSAGLPASSFSGADNRVLAFNFFSGKITSYATAGDITSAPKLHFYFPQAAPDHRYINIVGYENADNDGDLNKKLVGLGNRLLNINMSDMNNGHGILVESDDPYVKGGGAPELSGNNTAISFILLVHVRSWDELHGDPVLE